MAVNVIAPEGSDEIPIELTVTRRGVIRIPEIVLVAECPFGIFRTRRSAGVRQEITICPWHVASVFDAAAEQQLRTAGNLQRLVTGLAGDEEYVGSREYTPGMSVRRWDHASSARLAKPIVREFGANTKGRVILILDTSVNPSVSTLDEIDEGVERVLSLTASLNAFLSEQKFEVELLITQEKRHPRPDNQLPGDQTWLLRTLAETKYTIGLAKKPKSDRTDHQVQAFYITHTWDQRRFQIREDLSMEFPGLTSIVASDSHSETAATADVAFVPVSLPDEAPK